MARCALNGPAVHHLEEHPEIFVVHSACEGTEFAVLPQVDGFTISPVLADHAVPVV